MPELPEVETVVQSLRPIMLGKKIIDVILNRSSLRFPIPPHFQSCLINASVTSIDRRAKYILISLSNDHIWITHLGMSGMLSVRAADQKHDHAIVTLSSKKTIIFNDPRRFGFLDVVHKDYISEHKYLAHLGYEPLDRAFTARALFALTSDKKTSIKSLIMDQKYVVGVGNIYASESLYLAKIHPEMPCHFITMHQCEELVAAIKSTLKRAIKAGGSTIQMYHNPMGGSGYFQHDFKVYDREGEYCPLHKTNVTIKRITQQGRSTYFCPACQKMPRR